MSLTFGQAKQILAQYQGRGGKLPTAAHLNTFVLKVLQYLLITGSPNSEKVFELYSINGQFTAPYELETPLKIKINGKVGNVVSKWFEYRSAPEDCKGYVDLKNLAEDPNEYYTAYDLPLGGSQVGVTSIIDESPDSFIIIQGEDPTGRPIFTNHKGAEISGEYLTFCKGVTTWSNVTFGKITGVVKTRTLGYIPIYWKLGTTRGFLSDYSPVEEVPTYRRFILNMPSCPSHAKISIIGKTRLKEAYSDNDRIPFDNLLAIEVAGQAVNAQYNSQLDDAVKSDNFLQTLVNRESVHKRVNNGNAIEVFYANSAGTIKGIV